MRIRQVRPEFFSDPIVSRLTADVRLTYIGLWCVADDAGWLVWDVPNIGALLSPYESIRPREKRVDRAGFALGEAGRLVFYRCGCAQIPKLEEHQRIGGNKSFTVQEKHAVHTRTDKSIRTSGSKQPYLDPGITEIEEVHTNMDKSAGKVGNVRVGNGTLNAPASAPEGAGATDEALLAAYRRQGLPVDVH